MKKLLDAKREIGKVAKNAKNPHFKNTYADVNALLEAVEPILHTHGLLLLQPIIEGKVVTQIIDVESGQVIESSLPLPSNVTAQQMGSFVSYFRRYTLQSLLSLQTTEDDDGNKASTPPQPKLQPQLAPFEVEVIEAIKDFKTKAELKYYLGTLSEMEKTPAVQEFAKNYYKTLN